MKVPFLDLRRVHAPLDAEIMGAIGTVIANNNYILGAEVEKFEREYAEYCGTSYAAAVSSGTDALELILRAFNVKEGDEVILPANTFIATATAVHLAGAKPVLVDIDDAHNIDPQRVSEAINSKTVGILPVHLYGQPAEMTELRDIASRNNLFLIEDACQAHGATYFGRPVGSIGDAAAFSFFPGKNLGAMGDAGIVTSNDPAIIERIKMLRNYGQRKKYFHEEIAFNRRMDTLQAAVLSVKLPHLNNGNSQRRDIAARYDGRLEGLISTPSRYPNREHVYHLYVVMAKDTEERDELQKYLTEQNIGTGIHYPRPIHLQKAFAHLGHHEGDFAITENAAGRLLSLPIFPGMTGEETEYVCEKVKGFYNG